jgi:hypothetical protein
MPPTLPILPGVAVAVTLSALLAPVVNPAVKEVEENIIHNKSNQDLQRNDPTVGPCGFDDWKKKIRSHARDQEQKHEI